MENETIWKERYKCLVEVIWRIATDEMVNGKISYSKYIDTSKIIAEAYLEAEKKVNIDDSKVS